ncbi:MAG: glycosyltransferase family 4 protein [Campylobacterota bacterium]
MNIWIVNHYAMTPQLPGITRHFDFSKELISRGHKVTVFASSYHHSKQNETKEYHGNDQILQEEIEGVTYVWIKTASYHDNGVKRVINMYDFAKTFYKNAPIFSKHDRPDVVVGSSLHLFGTLAAFLFAKKHRIPFVLEIRDLWPQTLIDMGMSKWHPFVLLQGWIERYLYKNSKKIITLLPKSHLYIEKFGIDPKSITYIPNGTDLQRFDITVSKDTKLFKDGQFSVVYAGSIGEANNIETLIETARLLQEHSHIQFIIAGGGPLKNLLQKRAEEYQLSNVLFLGSIPKNDIIDILKSSDCLIFPLKYTPVFRFGISSNKLFDYMASKKPIIFASNAVNNPVKDANGGLTIPPEDENALSKAILQISNMSKEAQSIMGQNAYDYVKTHHAIPILVDLFEKTLIEEISRDT